MAKLGMPQIDIEFIQKAVSAIERSKRGITLILCVDEKVESVRIKSYAYETEIVADDYNDDNLKAIKRAFLVAVNKVYVITAPSDSELSAFTDVMEGMKYNYVCCLVAGMQQELCNYIISKNLKSKGKKYVAVVASATTADSKYIVNIKNASVHDVDADVTVPMVQYLPRITSILANLPMNRSCTYFELEDIDAVDMSFVTTEKDIDAWVDEGYLVLFKDEDVIKIGRGVNSLTTFTSTDSEDIRKIIIVESMNLMLQDIYETFKNYYIGKYKNSYDNQCLFISAVNTYFRTLAQEEILDNEYDNHAYIDVEAQRDAWLGIGKTEAVDWDENKVKKMTFKSYIYLGAQVKILDAVEDLKFKIAMA